MLTCAAVELANDFSRSIAEAPPTIPDILVRPADSTLADRIDKTKEKEAEKEKEKAEPSQSTPIYIYRYGGTNPGNLTPTEKDKYTGLSFSTIPKPGAARTTIEAINATGLVYAFKDGPTHVSVIPVDGTMEDWIKEGSSSKWTQAVKFVVIRWG